MEQIHLTKEDVIEGIDLWRKFYETFRYHAEQRFNALKYLVKPENFNPSEKVEYENLMKLINEADRLFPDYRYVSETMRLIKE